ncbi:NUDIX hydrolase [Nocardia carnea]|uniref:NUDIX hydrolase n=1 Tax=Nocardia carnea TaxID=37328 RepID=UPI0024548219|nr:NUDIX hydrolase [Nocardia carnea]
MTEQWPLLDREYPYTYKLGRIRRDTVCGRDGGHHTLTVLETAPAVYVVPVTTDHQILMLRQYRQTLCRWGWELPAGSMFDHIGDPEELAAQELREEAGASASRFEHVGHFHDSIPITTSRCDIYLARDTVIDRVPAPGHTELIAAHLLPADDVLDMARTGVITDGRSALALLRCEPLINASISAPPA